MDTYEKKYKEALVHARQKYNTTENVERKQWLEELFPELKESEDERIRKAISQCIEDMRGQFEKLYSVHHKDAIAWLEKQGEQKFNKCNEDDIRIKERIVSIIKEIKRQPLVRLEDWDGYIAWLEKQGKTKWTEEDESKVKEIVYFLDTAKVHYASTKALDDCIEWLKSLNQRMEEQL